MTQRNSSDSNRVPASGEAASEGSASERSAERPVDGAAGDGPSSPAPDSAETPALFDAVLTPHRSLSPAGFAILMATIAGVGFVGGMAFLLAGAWPVTGFGAIEIGLFYLLFRLNYRSARIRERVRLTADALEIERRLQNGSVRRWSFQPYWLKVHMADPPDTDSRLTLTSHGKSLSIGAFLSPDERLEFANALRAELARLRAFGPARPEIPGGAT